MQGVSQEQVFKQTRASHQLAGLASSPRLYTWATIGPVLVWVALFTIFPFGFAIYLSTHKYHLIQQDHPFVGLLNFERVITDELFAVSARNTVGFTLVAMLLVTLLGLAVALLLNNRLRGFGIVRALILLPWAIPLVSAGIIWKLMVHGNFGAVNGLLLQFGFIENYISFLGQMPHAFMMVIVAHVWREFPLAAILFLATMQAIPPELYDAAKVDGAGRLARFRYVTFPLLRTTLLVVLVYETMIGLAVFDLVYVLTGGGPGTGTTLISWLAWTTTFKSLNLGRGAALSLLMAMALVFLIVAYMRILRTQEEVT
jgi:multiple sugar transport system permease protein